MNTLIAVSGLGIFCLLAEIINLRKAIVPVSVVALLAILGLTVSEFNHPSSWYYNMIVVSNFSVAFSSLFIVLTVFLILMSGDYYKDKPSKFSDFIAIKIFLLAGAIAMVSFGNLSMFFIGIEILSIALYILAGSERLSLLSNEAGMKYFLLGSFASGFILFGICLVYGATGYFDVAEIYELSQGAGLPIWFYFGITMMLIGMLFKIAAAPFHFWAPDVYEGSPTLVTATMSTLAKVVAVATLYKLVTGLNKEMPYSFEIALLAVAILTMFVGNLLALRQENIKRMMAFSGISHAGFMLLALLSLTTAAGTLFYYTAAYALAGIAAFAVITAVTKNKETQNVADFNGLGKRHPILAAILTMSLLSMAGIPIFAGFFAKFSLFTQTIEAGYLIAVIVGVVNSIISIGYYFKLILAMYNKEADDEVASISWVYTLVAVVAIVLNIGMGIYPSCMMDLLK
ncbi:MAG: NADH-quinone oxidoreductase subunit N [Flavobacterium sp.]|jgi:NADH-quinone oxidoreductase subunit N|uniref:NADH-quinone oxidoreductase subunit N n=1 Tax=Flavobacterium sp. TaxID=239 RepID=UPI0022BE7155|nr:NADH-quinone oxidoreductase subunit N [Flavobacterium sp.]MCZ8169984.1 NADH-quinone oxidoreductase subunit N [Flavobacterium sp.]MCZ8298485.1 NADH-quinone oxidoreductase subunit N [Flavobacterium sp.]